MSLHLKAWTRPDQGALFVVTGASGTGKTTLVREALRVVPDVDWSVSVTTRAPRAGERDGVDYHFVDRARFEALRDSGALLESAEVYGNGYGTPRAPVESALAGGRSVLLEIDLAGARQVRQRFPAMIGIFVLPRSLADLNTRLRGRATDSEEIIARRIREAHSQIAGCGEFEYLVVNDDLSTAHDCFQAVLVAELQRASRRASLVTTMTSSPDP